MNCMALVALLITRAAATFERTDTLSILDSPSAHNAAGLLLTTQHTQQGPPSDSSWPSRSTGDVTGSTELHQRVEHIATRQNLLSAVHQSEQRGRNCRMVDRVLSSYGIDDNPTQSVTRVIPSAQKFIVADTLPQLKEEIQSHDKFVVEIRCGWTKELLHIAEFETQSASWGVAQPPTIANLGYEWSSMDGGYKFTLVGLKSTNKFSRFETSDGHGFTLVEWEPGPTPRRHVRLIAMLYPQGHGFAAVEDHTLRAVEVRVMLTDSHRRDSVGALILPRQSSIQEDFTSSPTGILSTLASRESILITFIRRLIPGRYTRPTGVYLFLVLYWLRRMLRYSRQALQ